MRGRDTFENQARFTSRSAVCCPRHHQADGIPVRAACGGVCVNGVLELVFFIFSFSVRLFETSWTLRGEGDKQEGSSGTRRTNGLGAEPDTIARPVLVDDLAFDDILPPSSILRRKKPSHE